MESPPNPLNPKVRAGPVSVVPVVHEDIYGLWSAIADLAGHKASGFRVEGFRVWVCRV